MITFSNLFMTKGNEKARDIYCIALFEKAWKAAEQERRIPGAEDVNRHLVSMIKDAVKPQDFRDITRLRKAFEEWKFLPDLQPDKCRQLAIIQMILLTEIFGDQYRELLASIRVRELLRCCDEYIREREKKLDGKFTISLSIINPVQITDSNLKLKIRQYHSVLSLRSILNSENADMQKISAFSRSFNSCISILETSTDSLCVQFIKKVLALLPTVLTSYLGFFRADAQQLIKNIENLGEESINNTFAIDNIFD